MLPGQWNLRRSESLNLLERIDRRLSDARARIQASDFEDCAVALLSETYRGLVPITGGSDAGLDGEITMGDELLGLIVTSSRTWEGAQRSLRGSLRSMTRNDLPVRKVIVANLAELNRTRREKLRGIASEFRCDLIQAYDRQFFANQFRIYPEWRIKILGIAGGAFCLSREPRGGRPVELDLPTIGREDLLDATARAVGDLVLFGVPGVGKTHIASRIADALFLDGAPSSEQLLDDLLAADPRLVIVDDAGGRSTDLERLLHARKTEGLNFRVIATCWPHEVESVTDRLPGAGRLEVDRLTREEIGTILRERGVTRLSVIARILEQAQGRPAWALHLADLLIDSGDWRSLWTGAAIREQILSYLRRSRAAEDAIEILAVIALLGGAEESEARTLRDLYRLTPTEFTRLIRSIAIAGLLDIERRTNGLGQGTTRHDHYNVAPPIIAASIASAVFFAGRAPAIGIDQIRDHFPKKAAAITQSQIHCALAGAIEPVVPTTNQFEVVLAEATTVEEHELMRSFSLIGEAEAQAVLNILACQIVAACRNRNSGRAERCAKFMAGRVADVLHEGRPSVIADFFDTVTLIARNGFNHKEVVTGLVEDVRDARSGEAPTAADLQALAKAAADLAAGPELTPVWVELAAQILTPTFDGNFMHPEVPRQFVLQSFTWSAPDMASLFETLRNGLARHLPYCGPDEMIRMFEVCEDYVGLQQGFGLKFGGSPSAEQRAASGQIARALALDLVPGVTSRGLRARFNQITAPLEMRLDDPDALFTCLTCERELGVNWQEARERNERELARALKPYVTQPPDELMTWLAEAQDELARVTSGSGSVAQVISHVARTVEDPIPWLATALQRGLGAHSWALVSATVAESRMDHALASKLLQDDSCRTALIEAVLRHPTDVQLAELVITDLRAEDIRNLESCFAIRETSAEKLAALFAHPYSDIRGLAAALWAAEARLDADDITPEPAWVDAMMSFKVPSVLKNYAEGEALMLLARTAPAGYIDLLGRHADDVARYDDFDEWQESAALLLPNDRDRLWRRVRHSPMARELFWVIAGNDTDWIRHIHERGEVDISPKRLLHAARFQHGVKIPLASLAVAFMPLGVELDDLLWTLEVGTGFGEEHERLERYLATCQTLSRSDDPSLARLGTRGVEIYEPRLADARKRARDAAVRGVW